MAVSSSSTSLLNSLSALSLSSPSQTPPPPTTVSLTSPPSSLKTLKHEQSTRITPVAVNPDESEDSLIYRFRREVLRARILQDAKRRRFHETNQEKRKRRMKEAARRNAKSRRPWHPLPVAQHEEKPKEKVYNEEDDNWEDFDVEIPYSKSR